MTLKESKQGYIGGFEQTKCRENNVITLYPLKIKENFLKN